MRNNFQIRLITALVLVLIVLPLVYLPMQLFGGVILIGILIAMLEFLDVGKERFYLQARYFIIPISLIIIQYITNYFFQSIFLILLCLAFIGLCIWSVVDQKMEIPAFLYVLFVTLYAGVTYEALHFIQEKSAHYLLFLFLAVFLTDTGAYFIGRRFGKHKLAVYLSPKKTIEGAVGGLVIGSLSAIGFVFLIGFIPGLSLGIKPTLLLVLSAIGLSICSEFGDLFASKVKRFVGKKDFGFIFPGHGGIIDRVDGLVLASILFYIILHFV